MTKYDLLGIHIGGGSDIEILSTDETVVKWITEQIQTLSPTVQIREESFLQKLPQSKNHSAIFSKMDYKQYSIGLWLIQELCHSGWEPFGDISFSLGYGFERITLRRRRDD